MMMVQNMLGCLKVPQIHRKKKRFDKVYRGNCLQFDWEHTLWFSVVGTPRWRTKAQHKISSQRGSLYWDERRGLCFLKITHYIRLATDRCRSTMWKQLIVVVKSPGKQSAHHSSYSWHLIFVLLYYVRDRSLMYRTIDHVMKDPFRKQ